MTATLLLLAVTLAPADAPTPPPDAAVSDAGELQGEWEVVEVNSDRRELTFSCKGQRWVFAGMSYQIFVATGRAFALRTIRVDVAHDPSAFDEMCLDMPPLLCIYRRSGDDLVLVQGSPARRPSSFDPAPGVVVWTLRRVKK
jgi:uncharacterized protein (TIGR03067 family)